MSFNYFAAQRVLLATMTAVSVVGSGAKLYAGSCCGSDAKEPSHHAKPSETHQHHEPAAEQAFQAPHGGQLTKTIWNYFEVVYEPTETRVYAFDMFRSPVRVAAVKGQVAMHVRSSGAAFTYPLRYVQAEQGQDYLAASIDLTRVRKGDLDVKISLNNLPNSAEPDSQFSQVFGSPSPTSIALTPRLMSAAVATAAERRGVGECCTERAGCCGLSGTGQTAECCRAGGEQPVAKPFARGPSDGASPLRRLPAINELPSRPEGQGPPSLSTAKVVVAKATSADAVAIRAQGNCPVMKQPLGSHGPPTKLLIDDQALFVCCQGCVAKVKENPQAYLAMVASHR